MLINNMIFENQRDNIRAVEFGLQFNLHQVACDRNCVFGTLFFFCKHLAPINQL